MQLWCHTITAGDASAAPLAVAVQELSAYFEMPEEEVVRRCRDWETDSLGEWKQKDRSTPGGLLEFYQTQTSWIFDTMLYHAEQCAEEVPAESVDIAEGFFQRIPNWMPGRHLDFGAGPGSSSLFFHNLGWQVSLADISTSFLDFARWRFDRRQVPARFYESSKDVLPESEFDLITALDVIVHVPDVPETLAKLHRALKPGGYLVFNIDSRPMTDITAWHLYDEQFPVLRQVRRIGFNRLPKIKYFHVYQKTDRVAGSNALIGLADDLRYNRLVNGIGHLARGARQTMRAVLKPSG